MLSLSALFCDDKVRALVRLLQDHPPLAPLERRDTVAAMGTSAVLLQLPEPPLPGNVVASGSTLTMQCSCAAGLELGPSHTLALELPSTHAPSARCAATKLRIALSPSPAAATISPTATTLTAEQVGAVLLRLPFTRGRVRGPVPLENRQPLPLLADAQGLSWAKLTLHHFSDVEARTDVPVMGTPGGDLAEFFFMVQAAERLQMRWFDAAAVHALMRSYLLRTPKLSFYHATDVQAAGRLAAAVGAGSLDLKAPPPALKWNLLQQLPKPEHTGSRFLRLLLGRCTERAGSTGDAHVQPRDQLRCALLRETLLAFYRLLWSLGDDHQSSWVRAKLRLVVWDAPAFAENAWLKVSIRQECADSAVAPLLPPTRKDPAGAAAAAAFVHHPQLVAIQRRETARLLAAELPLIDRVSLEAETNRLADVYLLAFEREADRVIPSYDIEFE